MNVKVVKGKGLDKWLVLFASCVKDTQQLFMYNLCLLASLTSQVKYDQT